MREPCPRCGASGLTLLVDDRQLREWACGRCGELVTWRRLPGDEPMPSERGMPAAELLDADEKPARTLGEIIRAALERRSGE